MLEKLRKMWCDVNAADPSPDGMGFVVRDNPVETRALLAETMIKALRPLCYSKKTIPGLALYINGSANDAILAELARGADFARELRDALENARIDEARNARLQCYCTVPPVGSAATLLGPGVWLLLRGATIGVVSAKARVSALQGSLLKKYYVLDPIDGARFNIGRGSSPRLENGRLRLSRIRTTKHIRIS